MSEHVIKSEEEFLSELLVSDPVIKKLDERILERKSARDGAKSKINDLRAANRKALSNITKAARGLAKATFDLQMHIVMVKKRSNVSDIRYEKQKRIRYLKMEAHKLRREAGRKAALEYHRTVLGKKVSPPT